MSDNVAARCDRCGGDGSPSRPYPDECVGSADGTHDRLWKAAHPYVDPLADITEDEWRIINVRLPLLTRIRAMSESERTIYGITQADAERQQQIREQMAFQDMMFARAVTKKHPQAVNWGFGVAEDRGLLPPLATACASCGAQYPTDELRRCICGTFMCYSCYDATGRCVGEQCDAGARAE